MLYNLDRHRIEFGYENWAQFIYTLKTKFRKIKTVSADKLGWYMAEVLGDIENVGWYEHEATLPYF